MQSYIKYKNESGVVLVAVLVIASLFIVMAGGLVSLQLYQNKLYQQQIAKFQSLHIAEAGANYYRWFLAHNHTDYYDGTGADPGGGGEPYGPYIHDYTAPSSGITGKFSLEITPPPAGSTIVRIKSTGWLDTYPNIKRSVEVRYGLPSLAHYSFLSGSDVWFGDTESVVGEMHSNGGVRMDGINDSVVASARQTFDCPSGLGCSTQATCQTPCNWQTASSTCSCPGVFGTGANYDLWNFPVTTVPLNSVTIDLDTLRSMATSSCAKFKVTGSNKGYHITFNSNGTFTARLVRTLMAGVSQRNDDWSILPSSPQYYVSYSEQYNSQGSATTCAMPSNGIIFIEDGDAWVDGTVKGRVTLAAATLPDQSSKRRTIFINDDLQYYARDGSNVLGLIAQKDIRVPRYAPTNLTIDAIMLAQWGRVYRNLYQSRSVKTSIEVYGGIITNLTWTWSWISGITVVDGYTTTQSIYDPDVTYSPPPSFPTAGEYAFISWEED